MGRTEPSVDNKQPASVRRDARAKRAKATANKLIPAMLAAHPRARRGVEASELIIDPPTTATAIPTPVPQARKGDGRNRHDEDGYGSRNTEDTGANQTTQNGSTKTPRISLHIADTLTAAYSLLIIPSSSTASSPISPSINSPNSSKTHRDLTNTTSRVGILNMASPLTPGGGFLLGAQGQEEKSLCGRTTLLPSLHDRFYRLPELGVVYTRDVLVFRGPGSGKSKKAKKEKERVDAEEGEEGEEEEEGDKGEGDGYWDLIPKPARWFVDVASAGMLRQPEVDVDADSGWARYASPADRELAVSKMRAVMRVFVSKGVRRVVLGAWGCGAYGNPIGEIARAWRKVLLGGSKSNYTKSKGKSKKEKATESWESIEHIVFAIDDAGMARAFATAFGEDALEMDEPDEEEDAGSYDDEDEEDEKVKELRSKIQEMELRAEQARTPQLRAGLDAVLDGLRRQLPGYGDGDSSRQNPASSKHDKDRGSEDESRDEESTEESDDEDEGDRSGHDSES
ncbi:hypothetical protein F5Y04DRAFT_261217 [Hypomontagnella monticulosa]|nr:hypothetical protein F5Y04DRAFT_261217 [Hypomontagnella monticulosa]